MYLTVICCFNYKVPTIYPILSVVSLSLSFLHLLVTALKLLFNVVLFLSGAYKKLIRKVHFVEEKKTLHDINIKFWYYNESGLICLSSILYNISVEQYGLHRISTSFSFMFTVIEMTQKEFTHS